MDGFQYINGNLDFFPTAEGYVKVLSGFGISAYKYVFNYKDHLGNVRLSYSDSDLNGAINPATEIIEESNYYPFGLEQKGYNNVVSSNGNSVASKFKYNGIELEESLGLNLYEMEFRQYDPAIGRFTSIDPVTHFSYSTYSAFNNNPVFWADPSGADTTLSGLDAQTYFGRLKDYIASKPKEEENEENDDNEDESSPPDDITVNSKGIITDVVRNGKPNRFFDEDGNELSFHDSEGVDKDYAGFTYSVGDRLFYSISTAEMNSEIMKSGLIMQRWIAKTGGTQGLGYYIWSLFSAADKGHGGYDFAEGFLANKLDNKSFNTSRNRSRTTYNDGTGFFRLGNTNSIYNIYDAGNYMWGRAMGMSGFSYGEVWAGSQVNELGTDSNADQQAIKKGFNGN